MSVSYYLVAPAAQEVFDVGSGYLPYCDQIADASARGWAERIERVDFIFRCGKDVVPDAARRFVEAKAAEVWDFAAGHAFQVRLVNDCDDSFAVYESYPEVGTVYARAEDASQSGYGGGA